MGCSCRFKPCLWDKKTGQEIVAPGHWTCSWVTRRGSSAGSGQPAWSLCSLSESLSVVPDSSRSTSEAAALERELLDEYRFGRQQLVEMCGHASAVAVTKVPALSARGYSNLPLEQGN